MNIKDAVVDFFHNQGIIIVTIQPEFKAKSVNDKRINGMPILQCLMGCQSLECAPKTCCSTNDLQLILAQNGEEVINGIAGCDAKLQKGFKTPKKDKESDGKSRSLLSLNVTSLMKLRRFAGSTQDIIKKSASESHVTRIADDNDDIESKNQSSPTNSTVPSIANDSNLANSSIDELKELEFHKHCDERSEQRMPPTENLSRSFPVETTKHCEDSGLLKKAIDHCNDSEK